MRRRGYRGCNRLMALLVLLFTLPACYIRTSETEVGVKVSKLTLWGEPGVQNEIYGPGQYHFYIPLLTEMYTFDTALQSIIMTQSHRSGDILARDDLLFKTIDGNDISLDVTVQYRILPEKAAIILQDVARNDLDLRMSIIRAIARSRPRDIFGELTTEEFYNAASRDEKAEQSKQALNEVLEPLGVLVEKVLTDNYRFNEAYQRAIEEKKVADQEVEKNKSATKAIESEWLRKLNEAKGEVNTMIAKADGEFRQAKIEADAYFGKMQEIAEAIIAEGEAKAQGIAAQNKALAGAGGKTMVKLEIAKALQGKKIILLPLSEGGLNLKTTDMNELLKLYGVQSLSK